MIDKQTKNQIIENLFILLSDFKQHLIVEKDLIDNYNSQDYKPIIKLLIQDLINKGYIKSLSGSNNVILKIDTLGLEVLEAGSWTNYNNQTINEQTPINYTNYEKVGAVYHGDVTAENVKAEIKESANSIGGDNLGTQSSESDFKKVNNKQKIIPEPKEIKTNPIVSFILKYLMQLLIGLALVIIGILIEKELIDISFITDRF